MCILLPWSFSVARVSCNLVSTIYRLGQLCRLQNPVTLMRLCFWMVATFSETSDTWQMRTYIGCSTYALLLPGCFELLWRASYGGALLTVTRRTSYTLLIQLYTDNRIMIIIRNLRCTWIMIHTCPLENPISEEFFFSAW
jgi:hypothetical protein